MGNLGLSSLYLFVGSTTLLNINEHEQFLNMDGSFFKTFKSL